MNHFVNRLKWIFFILPLYINLLAGQSTRLSPFDSSAVDLEPDASFIGTQESERVGYALCGGGDVNGDGYDDFMIGSFHNYHYGYDAGTAYLILGGAPFPRGRFDSLIKADAQFFGESRFQGVGYSIANNGDLNGDGLDDIIIGAPAGNSQTRVEGKVYIVLGRQTADWGNQFILASSADGALEGEKPWDRLGVAVTFVGDMNGDGFDDFLVGAPDYDFERETTGKIYFFLGKASGWHLKAKALPEARATFISVRSNASAGFSLAGVGDVNGDALPDFLIGAPGINQTFLIYGRKNPNWGYNFNLNQDADVIFTGEQYGGEQNGYSVAAAGDVNGDGINDMLISAIHSRANGRYTGKVFLVFGRTGGWNEKEVSLITANASYMGECAGDLAGWSVASAGDVNGDGFAECLVGMFNEENKRHVPGKAYFIQGATDGWAPDQLLSTVPAFVGEKNYQLCGFCVSRAGDIDGDHWGDFLISAPYWGPDSCGQVYLFRSERQQHKIEGSFVYYQSHRGIPQLGLNLQGEFIYQDSTDTNGAFAFDVYGGSTYELTYPGLLVMPQGDNCVTAYDAALAARAALNLEKLSVPQQDAGDVDLDQKVTMGDAALILRHVIGLPPLNHSQAGKWHVIDSLHIFKNIQTDFLNQNYRCFVRGDIDASWQIGEQNTPVAKIQTQPMAVQLAAPEGFVSLPIIFEGGEQVLAFEARVNYDPTVLRFENISLTDFGKEFKLQYNESGEGLLKIGAFSIVPAPGAGCFARVQFCVRQNVHGKTVVSVEQRLLNAAPLPACEWVVKISASEQPARAFRLNQNYPNPFNATTRIEYEIPEKSRVEISVWNGLGQTICNLVNQLHQPGCYQVSWHGIDENGNSVPSGIYFIKLLTNSYTEVKKIILLR